MFEHSHDLFYVAPTRRVETPATHRSDPQSSHIAENVVTKTGVRHRQQDRTIEAVKKHPGMTSAELALLIAAAEENVDTVRTMLARRLSECVTRGLLWRGALRDCAVKKTLCATWLPGEPA